jgi:hypothetical protein
MFIVLALLRLIQRHRPIYAENSANKSNGHGSIPVLGIDRCPYRYWHCHDGVHFRYGHLPSDCPYQYWQCRDGVHFQYGHLPSARTSIGIAAMEFISSTGTWQVPVPVLALLFAAQTSEFYCTLEKLR